MLNTMPSVPDVVAQGYDVEFEFTPKAPPGSNGFLELFGWGLWVVILACLAAIVYSGGKFAWEKHQQGSAEAPKILIWSCIGLVIASSAQGIVQAILAASA